MAQQPIDLGTTPNDGTGDPLRGGGGKINEMFTEVYGLLTTREFNRPFSELLVFDKNQIKYAPHIATGHLNFQVSSPVLEDQFSAIIATVLLDGTQSLNFTGHAFLYGITNGQILPAGNYRIYCTYSNGEVDINVPGVSTGTSLITTLATPANFAVGVGAGDPETELDLTWDDVANETNYEIQVSDDGVTGWATLTSPVADAVAYTHSGLTEGTTKYYKIRSIGDGVSFASSAFSSVINGQTEDATDVTPPTFIFLPANGNATHPVNRVALITPNEPVFDATTGAVIDNSNADDYITCKQTNSGGANIPVTVTYDGTAFRVKPVTSFGQNQVVYLAVHDVRDVNGNAIASPVSITFTTTEYAEFNGTSNRVIFGDILDSVWAAVDTNFWVKETIQNFPQTGQRVLFGKASISDNQRGWYAFYWDTDVYFAWYPTGNANPHRLVKWTDVVPSTEHTPEFKYDGSIDTNDGLDRIVLEIDGVVQGSKTMDDSVFGLSNIANNTAQLSLAMLVSTGGVPTGANFFQGEAKDFIIRSNGGTVVELNVPDLATGIDISGNSRHGTWVE